MSLLLRMISRASGAFSSTDRLGSQVHAPAAGRNDASRGWGDCCGRTKRYGTASVSAKLATMGTLVWDLLPWGSVTFGEDRSMRTLLLALVVLASLAISVPSLAEAHGPGYGW